MTQGREPPEMFNQVNGGQHEGASRLLLDDASMVLLVLNDVRGRLLTRLTGLSGLSSGESLMITLIALGAVAKMVGDATPPMSRPAAPSAVNVLFGGSAINELAHGIGGSASRAVPGFSALVAFALIWRYHPVARGSLGITRWSGHAVKTTEHRLRAFYTARAKQQG